jgi:biopolymer transport protein ExbB
MPATFERRRVWLVLIMMLGTAATLSTMAPRALAQEAKEEAKEAPKAEAAAPAEGAEAAAPTEEGAEGEAPKLKQSYFMWFIKNSGAIGAVILMLSIYFVSTVGRLFLEMRPSVAMPPDLIDESEEMVKKRQFKEVFAAVKDDTSPWGRIVSTGIAELPNGLAEAREAAERVAEVINVENEKKISMLAVLGSLGPMIGLLGTLKGMIASFSVIAMSDTQLKASEVAGGISEALLLTFEGVALSVPAIYFYAVFRNRVSYLGVSTLLNADEFIRSFAHAARSKGGAAPAAAAAPAPAAAAAVPQAAKTK